MQHDKILKQQHFSVGKASQHNVAKKEKKTD